MKVHIYMGWTVLWYCAPLLTGVGGNLWWSKLLVLYRTIFRSYHSNSYIFMIHVLPCKMHKLKDVWQSIFLGKIQSPTHLGLCVFSCCLLLDTFPVTYTQLLFLWTFCTICLSDQGRFTYAITSPSLHTPPVLHKWLLIFFKGGGGSSLCILWQFSKCKIVVARQVITDAEMASTLHSY